MGDITYAGSDKMRSTWVHGKASYFLLMQGPYICLLLSLIPSAEKTV